MNQDNGGIIGKINTPTTSVASGVWSLQDQFEAQTSSIWPLAFPQTTIANACRFDDGSSDNLTRTATTPTDNKKQTTSVWVKRSALSGSSNFGIMGFVDTSAPSNSRFHLYFYNDQLAAFYKDPTITRLDLKTNRLFRDTSAWYHIVLAIDTTEGTASDRTKLYVNGVQETSFSSSDYPVQNTTFLDSGETLQVGRLTISDGSQQYYDGYIAEAVFIDGQALTPTNFGAFNPVTNIWEPRGYAGTYGTNGFKLNFSDSSALGDDTSGNGNDFTANNLTSIDQVIDTCSNNFCTLNLLTTQVGGFSLAQGNTEIQMDNTNEKRGALGTFGLTQGKWYWEAKYVSRSNPTFAQVGITDANTDEKQGYGEYDYSYRGETSDSNGRKVNNGTFTSYGDTYTTGDIIGVALDLDNNKIFFSKNGTFQASGNPVDGSNPTFTITDPSSTDGGAYFAAIGKEDADTGTFSFNFGSPSFSISSGNSDANGHGNFEYAVPSGYFSLCTKNLAEFG